MRKTSLLTLIALLAACDHPPAPAPAAPDPTVAPVPTAPALPAWPAPSLERLADPPSATDFITITRAPESADATVEVRTTRGPIPPSCDDAHPTLAITEDDHGSLMFSLAPTQSATVCLRDADGHVRASATSPGHRSVPSAFAMWRGGEVVVEQELEALDDDVTAILIVTGHESDPEQTPTPIGCTTMAPSSTNDDPPQICSYDCSAEQVALEIPRAAWDAVIASPAYRARSSDSAEDEVLYPPSIGVAFPIAVPSAHESIATCVRTAEGAVLTGETRWREISDGPWMGCTFDTVAGCLGASPTPFPSLARGDVLLGLTDAGVIVRAPVRTVRTQARRLLTFRTTRGPFSVTPVATVRAENGDVLASAIAVGTRLWTRAGVAIVESFEASDYDSDELLVDLDGAAYFLTAGFAVRDEGHGPEDSALATRAMPHVDEGGFSVGDGNADCSLFAEWPAATTTGGVVVHATRLMGRDLHVTRDATCEGTFRAPIDQPTLTAIASIAPRARIRVQLFGDAIECSGDYWVSRCDGADTTPLGDAMSWVSSAQCIPVGTPIDTPHGAVAIEKLDPGDLVTSYDAIRGLRSARVLGSTTHAHRAVLSATLDDGTELRATPDHVVMVGTPPREVAMRSLVLGDTLSIHRDGALITSRIVALASAGTETVVELRVSAPDTYFANGVLVHNY